MVRFHRVVVSMFEYEPIALSPPGQFSYHRLQDGDQVAGAIRSELRQRWEERAAATICYLFLRLCR